MITIYGLASSEDGIVRYIGQTKKNAVKRMNSHIKQSIAGHRSHKCHWIKKVLLDGFQITLTILKENATWNIDEIAFIHQYKNMRFKLLNVTNGGEGTLGYVHPAEILTKIANKNKGKKRTEEFKKRHSTILKGREFSKEHCKNLSISHIGNQYAKGAKYSKEICDRLSEKAKIRTKRNIRDKNGRFIGIAS